MLKLDLPEGLPTGCLLIFSGEAQFPWFWIANRLWRYTTKTSVQTAAIGRPSNTTFQLSLAPCFASSGMSVSTDPTLCTSASLYLSTPFMAAWLLLFGTFLQNTTISPYLEGTWNPTKSYFLYISHTVLYMICIFRLLCAKNEDLPYAGAGPHHWPRLSAGGSRSGSCNQTSPSSLQQLAGGGDDPPHVGGLWILWSYPVASHLLSLGGWQVTSRGSYSSILQICLAFWEMQVADFMMKRGFRLEAPTAKLTNAPFVCWRSGWGIVGHEGGTAIQGVKPICQFCRNLKEQRGFLNVWEFCYQRNLYVKSPEGIPDNMNRDRNPERKKKTNFRWIWGKFCQRYVEERWMGCWW